MIYRKIDIRPMIRTLEVVAESADEVVLELLVAAHDGRPAKVDDILRAWLGRPADELLPVRIRKLACYRADGQALVEPRPRTMETV